VTQFRLDDDDAITDNYATNLRRMFPPIDGLRRGGWRVIMVETTQGYFGRVQEKWWSGPPKYTT